MATIVTNLIDGIRSWFQDEEKRFFNNGVIFKPLGAVWVDTKVPYRLYNEIPELNQVISKKADMFSNGIFRLRDIKSNAIIEDGELTALLERPNMMQTQNKWMNNYSKQLDVYGNQFMYFNRPSKLAKYPTSIMNISPRYLSPILTGKLFDQIDISGVVSKYKYENEKLKREFKSDEIAWSKHDDLDDLVIGKSPLVSLKFPLSNTKLAYQYLNIISGEKGAIGMISGKTKDSAGALPMGAEQREKLEKQYSKTHGVKDGQSRVSIVSGDVAWTPMTYPTGELLLLEQIDANKLTICDHFNLNINLFSSKNQTYENVKNAIIQTYNDAIFPAADAFTQTLGNALRVPDNQRVELDYSHISMLQDDKGQEADIITKQLNSVKDAYEKGIITLDQVKNIYNNSFGLSL